MNAFDSRAETEEHQDVVRQLLGSVAGDLIRRGDVHDDSKLEPPEKATFDEYTAKLRDTTYDSPEYKSHLEAMKPALRHHYAVNDHHPEHFPGQDAHEVDCHDRTEFPGNIETTVCYGQCLDCGWAERGESGRVRDAAAAHENATYVPGGVAAMNLIQLTEMLCDWIAASRRHPNGDIHDSIRRNAERFDYDEEMEKLLHRTADVILELWGSD